MATESIAIALEPSGLPARFGAWRDEQAALWAATPAELPGFGPRVGLRRHLANARAAGGLIDALAAEVERVRDGDRERRAWQESVRERLQSFGESRLGWPAAYRRLMFGEAFFAASTDFARAAREFEPDLRLEDLWQALRNVWIANSLQMLLDRPVTLNPAVFAYSMLYPVTDNWLDDPRVSSADKRCFNERFGRRLAGFPVSAAHATEQSAFRLVERIEQTFAREDFPGVYESLLAIHGGQMRSLCQRDERGLTDAEILDISCEKGGSSVLADLYLVAGSASPAEERFAWGYGFFLQLLDDLQDVERDLAVGHQTLFTRAARRGPLDEPTARLALFIDRVLDGEEALASPELGDRKDLIRRNCRSLLVGAVAEQPRLFSRRFRRALAQRWPFSFRAMRRLRRRAERRLRAAASDLQRRTGAASLLEWLLAQTEPATL